jgi:WD40 repeat protein
MACKLQFLSLLRSCAYLFLLPLFGFAPLERVQNNPNGMAFMEANSTDLNVMLLGATWKPDSSELLLSGEQGVYLVTPQLELLAHYQLGDEPLTIASAWSPNSDAVASIEADGIVYLWNPTNGDIINTWETGAGTLSSIAWSPDGRKIVSGGLDTQLTVYNVQNRQLDVLNISAEERGFVSIHSISWHPDSRRVAFGTLTEGAVFLWDVETNERVLRIRSNGDKWIAISPDGNRMA